MKNYNDTVIGKKGQVITPAELRKKFGIETGDRFLVTAGAEDRPVRRILVEFYTHESNSRNTYEPR